MRPTCINLREHFGQTYKVRYESSRLAERTEFCAAEEVWLQIIPCRHGHIYPHGGNALAWSSGRRGPISQHVAHLPGVEIVQNGDDGINAVFDLSLFDDVAAVVQPKRKPPKRVMTPEQRALLSPHWFKSRSKQ